MAGFLRAVFAPQQYVPHGHCYLWQTPLVGLHVLSDGLIAIAYFSIPVLLLVGTYRSRQRVAFPQISVLFSGFIVLCGTGHLLNIWTLWFPAYWLSGAVQALTALVSIYTALELVTVIPQFLSLKSPADLEQINTTLQTEITERKAAQTALHTLVACTAATTGPEFFSVLVTSLATALSVDHVFVSEIFSPQPDEPVQARTLARWSKGQLLDPVTYALAGTPCAVALSQKQLYYCACDGQAQFPDCPALVDLAAECYLGVPLLDVNEVPIGVLCLCHSGCLSNPQTAKSIMSVFAARAAAELQRQRAELALKQANDTLEIRIQQRTAELAEATAAAEAANQAKSTFLARISHELRTPLNAVLGFAQVMSQDATLSDDHQQTLGIINRSGSYLLGLINDILEITKVEAGRVVLNETDFDLFNLLSGLEELLQPRAEAKGLTLRVACDRTVPRCLHGDEGKLRQILINLLGNAIKFTITGTVTLSLRCPVPGTLTVTVTDTGVGISPADQEQIFKLFFQSHHHNEQGTGLGLAITKGFVTCMGGEIAVQSTPDQGTTFIVTLPVAAVRTLAPARTSQRVVCLAPGQPACRILVVEDAPTNRLLLRKVLTSVGFELQEAINGQEAIDLWQRWHPHLILMDMQMPVMDGYQATAQIKQLAQTPVPIIALTASTFKEQQRAIRAAGCDACIHKPFQREHLLHLIAEHLGLRYWYEEMPAASQVPTKETVGKYQSGYLPA